MRFDTGALTMFDFCMVRVSAFGKMIALYAPKFDVSTTALAVWASNAPKRTLSPFERVIVLFKSGFCTLLKGISTTNLFGADNTNGEATEIIPLPFMTILS